MYRIILARHGESIWNQDSKFTGWTNIPLTDKGRMEAKKMAMVMKPYRPSIIFTSVLQRSIETSTIIQKELRMELKKNMKNEMKQKDRLDIPIHTSWRLNETTCWWEAPIAKPPIEEVRDYIDWFWNEENQEWYKAG